MEKPPDIAAKLRESEANDKTFSQWKHAQDATADCLTHLAVIAYSEAKSDEEREEVIHAAAIVSCTLFAARVTTEKALTPPPRAQYVQIFLKLAADGLKMQDKAFREALPHGARARSAHLAAEAEDKAVAAGTEPDHA